MKQILLFFGLIDFPDVTLSTIEKTYAGHSERVFYLYSLMLCQTLDTAVMAVLLLLFEVFGQYYLLSLRFHLQSLHVILQNTSLHVELF